METTRTRSPQQVWETALGELQLQVSQPNYRTWFGKTTGLSYQDNQFVIGVPNTFVAEYLEKNQLSLIEKALSNLVPAGVIISFQVNGSARRHRGNADIPEIPAARPAFSSLNPHYVFDSFIEGGCNRLARAAALAVAQNPGHNYNPLFLYGGAGLGKTHLLHAIGHLAHTSHINVICTSAEQFTNEFLSALRERSTDDFRDKYRSLGMLLIDDIQFLSGKEQTEESFFHTFNELHNTNRQIVITSDCPPKSMPRLEERLRSRFEWGLLADIQPPDEETRLKILRSKAGQKGASLGQDVLELIARRAQRNIRELEGSLNRVLAFARLLQAAPDVEVATRALEDIAGSEPDEAITPASIVAAVAEGFHLSTEDLKGPKRDKETVTARRVAMYLIRQETSSSLSQIGQEIGRDAAAVTTACKKVAADASPYLKRKIQEIQQGLHAKTRARHGH